MQQSFCYTVSEQFFIKSPSIKGLSDLTSKRDISKLTSAVFSEELELFFKNIVLDFSVSELEKLLFVL
jgi:hypothetical protein